MKTRSVFLLKVAIAVTLGVGVSGTAFSGSFYEGKVIRFVVGYSPGGGYDTYARAVARHIGKHIPGNPTVLVENKPGAGSLIAANYLYNKAKPDGLTIGVWIGQLVLYQALGDKKVKLDGRKVGWIGSAAKGAPVCAIMGFTGLRTLEDVLNSKKPIKMGGQRAGSTLEDLPSILNLTVGTKFNVISGYTGTARVRLAMQKREVDGACWTWESMKATARSMLDAKGDDRMIPFLIHNRWDDPEVKDLPLITDVIKDKERLATYRAWVAGYEYNRAYSLPPGVPKERLSILRKALKATMEDPVFLAEAAKSKLVIDYLPGEEVEKLVNQVLSISPEVKQNLQFLVRR
jgi:tripartite-type tricarboxylate transporter receptor subunit TctC